MRSTKFIYVLTFAIALANLYATIGQKGVKANGNY